MVSDSFSRKRQCLSFLFGFQAIGNFRFKISIPMAAVEIHLQYGASAHCENFPQAVQNQAGRHGIKIKARTR
jgi:hypothetical protein